MMHSMTGFASLEGHAEGWSWSWDLRSVNGRGLDLRLRLPDWIDGLEVPVRATLQKAAARGNITATLRVQRDSGPASVRVDPAALDAAIALVREVEDRAAAADLALDRTTAADLLGLRGVMDSGSTGTEDTAALRGAILASLPELVAAFTAMRAGEGTALHRLLAGQIDRIAQLVAEADGLAEARSAHAGDAFREALARVTQNAEGFDPDRVAQELAVLAVKTDVTEEIDRLKAHVAAARELIEGAGPHGRKLDFLSQEFNREANTLCSKSQYAPLTRVGLDLKHTIDQMREQIQNVE